MSWEKVATLGVAGAIAVAVLWMTDSPETVTVVITVLAALLTGLEDTGGRSADKVKGPPDQDREVADPEARA
jgi:hypothetical protein